MMYVADSISPPHAGFPVTCTLSRPTAHASTRVTEGLPVTGQTGMAVTRLESIGEGLIRDSLTVSSHRAYQAAQKAFLQFCSALQLPALPTSEQVLLLFIADLSQRVCHGTVRSYLSAIRHMHLSAGLPDPL